MYEVAFIFLLGLFIPALVVTTFSLVDEIREEDPTTLALFNKSALWGTLMALTVMAIFMLDTVSG